MALAQTLQEQLTCPICQDTYTDPMVLKCHHSICQECLEGLKNVSLVRWKVECPICREPCKVSEIQKDFRMITLLEAHQREGNSVSIELQDSGGGCCSNESASSTKGMRLCDICQKDPIRQRCKNCDQIICQLCANNHKSIPACKDHTLIGLSDLVEKEKATLKNRFSELKKEEIGIDVKAKEIHDYKAHLEEERRKAVSDINQWYDGIVQKATKQKELMLQKIVKAIDSEKVSLEEKDRIVTDKLNCVQDSLYMMQSAQLEDDPARIHGLMDSLKTKLDNKCLEEMQLNVLKMVIPVPPDVQVYIGKRWDETKAVHVSVKKHSANKQIGGALMTFPSSYTTTRLVKHKEVKITRGTKQIMIHHGLLWCLYDDHIDIYDDNDHTRIIKAIKNHIAVPNGMSVIANGNVVVACMSQGLMEFNYKGKFVGIISEGNICDVTSCGKTVFTLDYSDNRPYLKAFKKAHFNKWKNTLNREIQNDKCNTFNTLLSNQSSLYLSATEENVLIEYDTGGQLLARLTRPNASRLCCSDVWGNVMVSNYDKNEVWMLKNDQTWHKMDIDGLYRPYSASVDDEGGLWISNHTDTVVRYICQPQTL